MFEENFSGKKVFLTGHTGFKGAWLSLWLQMLGAEVTGYSLDIPTEPSVFALLDLARGMEDLRGDICEGEGLRRALQQARPDYVFHLAAQAIVSTSYQDPARTYAVNVMGTVNVLDAVRELDHACAVVIVTSDKCYENKEWEYGYRESDPLGGKDPYSSSKAAAELATRSYYHSYFAEPFSPVRVVSVRSGNVVGGGDWAPNRIVPDCIRAWQACLPVELRSPDAVRPWQHVLEPLGGYLAAAAQLMRNPALNGQAFNFGPRADQTCSVEQMVQKLASHWPAPDPVLVRKEGGFKESRLLKLSWEKAFQDLGWRPVLGLEETLRWTAEWYKLFAEGGQGLAELSRKQIAAFAQIRMG